MSQITRTYTFTDGTTAYGSQAESEIQNIVTAWNNHDSGASRWTVTDATTIKRSGTTINTIMQVVQTTSTTAFTTTSNAYQTTNCTATITPTSTSSTIMVSAMGILRIAANGVVVKASLFRGSTDLETSGNGFHQIHTTGSTITNLQTPCNFVFQDSPATIAATTYSVKIKNSDNSTTIGFGSTGSGGSPTTVMTLMELL